MDKTVARRLDGGVASEARSDARSAITSKTKAAGPRTTVKFGGVTVVVAKPSRAQLKQNVAASTEALERVTKRLVRPGVRLYAKKNVPLFSADPSEPGIYIRVLNGKTERGVVENGLFKVID